MNLAEAPTVCICVYIYVHIMISSGGFVGCCPHRPEQHQPWSPRGDLCSYGAGRSGSKLGSNFKMHGLKTQHLSPPPLIGERLRIPEYTIRGVRNICALCKATNAD